MCQWCGWMTTWYTTPPPPSHIQSRMTIQTSALQRTQSTLLHLCEEKNIPTIPHILTCFPHFTLNTKKRTSNLSSPHPNHVSISLGSRRCHRDSPLPPTVEHHVHPSLLFSSNLFLPSLYFHSSAIPAHLAVFRWHSPPLVDTALSASITSRRYNELATERTRFSKNV